MQREAVTEKHQKEQAIVQIQETEKVTVMRARQILENNNEHLERAERQFPAHFNCKIDEVNE